MRVSRVLLPRLDDIPQLLPQRLVPPEIKYCLDLGLGVNLSRSFVWNWALGTFLAVAGGLRVFLTVLLGSVSLTDNLFAVDLDLPVLDGSLGREGVFEDDIAEAEGLSGDVVSDYVSALDRPESLEGLGEGLV